MRYFVAAAVVAVPALWAVPALEARCTRADGFGPCFTTEQLLGASYLFVVVPLVVLLAPRLLSLRSPWLVGVVAALSLLVVNAVVADVVTLLQLDETDRATAALWVPAIVLAAALGLLARRVVGMPWPARAAVVVGVTVLLAVLGQVARSAADDGAGRAARPVDSALWLPTLAVPPTAA